MIPESKALSLRQLTRLADSENNLRSQFTIVVVLVVDKNLQGDRPDLCRSRSSWFKSAQLSVKI